MVFPPKKSPEKYSLGLRPCHALRACAVVMAAYAVERFFLLLGQIGHGHLGGEHQPRDTRCILYGASRDFGRVDDAGFSSTAYIDGPLWLFLTHPFI